MSGYTGLEIAVIGMAGKFPGASDIAAYWENLCSAKDCVSYFSDEELAESGVDAETLRQPNYVRAKGILADIHLFDSDFFGYTPREAEMMDPQTRLMHECAYHAIEDAGYDPSSVTDRIGLFAGSASNLFWFGNTIISSNGSLLAEFIADKDYMCARVANKLRLKGPVVNVQTACSTSLVAIHLAARSLLTGDCDMALAGGVSLNLPQKQGYFYQEGMISSSDGHCRAFDAAADGTVNGEGAGVVLLKKLSNAIKDNDNIYAVIKGSAINNDAGRSVGFTAPSIDGQKDVIASALRVAKVDPETISYVEAHGTGTLLGDPIEIEALRLAYNTNKTGYCAIGSVKTSIGHLGQAAGIAGFIKVVLSLRDKVIPANLHFTTPNPNINFDKTPFYVNAALRSWHTSGSARKAGVSSFGIGGTNAHVIVEEYAPVKETNIVDRVSENVVFTISGRDENALYNNCSAIASFISRFPSKLNGVAFTLRNGRQQFACRRAYTGKSAEELAARIRNDINEFENKKSKVVTSHKKTEGLAFLFPGQGVQYLHMAEGLYHHVPAIRSYIDNCFSTLSVISGIDFQKILFPTEGDARESKKLIAETKYCQPILFSVEYAIARFLMDGGIYPEVMIGHSLGEYVAATLAGVFSPEDALRLIYKRGQLMQATAAGKMAAIQLPHEQLKKYLNNNIAIAAQNSGRNCVVSGSAEDMNILIGQLKHDKIVYKTLNTDRAFHSHLMDSILPDYKKVLDTIEMKVPAIPIISNLTGYRADPNEVVTAEYWLRHLRASVLFSQSADTLLKDKELICLEIGPGSSLINHIKANCTGRNITGINMLKAENQSFSDTEILYQGLEQIWNCGIDVNWAFFIPAPGKERIPFPGYSFNPLEYPIKFKLLQSPIIDRVVSHPEIKTKPQAAKPDENEQSTEHRITAIFRDALGVPGIGLEDSFLDMGGDSLSSMIVISNIHKEFNKKIALVDFFAAPNARQLSRLIEASDISVYNPVVPALRKPHYMLSSAQKRLYIVHQMEADNISYNETLHVVLEGCLDINKLNDVLNGLISKYEILRTSFKIIDGEIEQVIEDAQPFEIEFVKAPEEMMSGLIEKFVHAFDLSVSRLFRVLLVNTADNRHCLVLDMHHIITDGTSMNLFLSELIKVYAGNAMGSRELQYKDYSEWQNAEEQKTALKEQETYWVERLGSAPLALNIPSIYTRPKLRSFKGAATSFSFNKALSSGIKNIALEEGVSLFMMLISFYYVLLHKLSGQEDILIGTAIAGRRHASLTDMMGMFVNMLVLRNFPKNDISFREFLQSVKYNTLEDFERQEFPYEELIEKLDIARDTSRNSLFDVAFAFQNMASVDNAPLLEIEDLTVLPMVLEKQVSKFDMTITGFESQGNIHFEWEYSTNLFNKVAIDDYIVNYRHIAEVILQNMDVPIRDIQLKHNFKISSVNKFKADVF